MANTHGRRRRRCFELDGALVHGDPDMSPEARAALQQVIAAARAQMEQTSLPPAGGEQEITDTGDTDR